MTGPLRTLRKQTMKNIKTILSSALALIVIFSSFSYLSAGTARADLPEANVLANGSFKYSSTTVSIVPVNVLATSTGRQYAIISNDGPVAAYLYFAAAGSSITLQNPSTVMASGTASNPFSQGIPAPHGGILLNASSTYEITADKNMYFGAVSAVTASSTATTTIDVLASQ